MTARIEKYGKLWSGSSLGGMLFTRDADKSHITYKVPLAIAMLTVAFEQWIGGDDFYRISAGDIGFVTSIELGLVFVSAALCLFSKTSRLAAILFAATVILAMAPNWMGMANHTWLALWTIPMAAVVSQWWQSDLYSLYVRVTLGIVMIAAFSQKVLAGTYVDGSYIYFLSIHGGQTERLFSFACDLSAGVPCLAHKLISQFILVWQLAVGILLLLGVKSLLFLLIEVSFLLGAGLFADEMNFQVLNIALLCIVFGVGMPIWLIIASLLLLLVDVFSIDYLYNAIIINMMIF